MDLATLVAGPGLGEVHPQFVPSGGDVLLSYGNEGADHLDPRVGALTNRLGHGSHELLPAVRVNGVIPRMRGDDEPLGPPALGKSGGDGEHDAVSERDDSGLHGGLLVVSVGDLSSRSEEIGTEEFIHESKGDGLVRDPEKPCLVLGKGDLLVVVLGAVVEADGTQDLVLPGGMVKGDDGIHSSADKHDDFHVFQLGRGGLGGNWKLTFSHDFGRLRGLEPQWFPHLAFLDKDSRCRYGENVLFALLMKSRLLVPGLAAAFGLLVFLVLTVVSKVYPGEEVPVQVTGAFLGAIVTAAITMFLLHGQSQAEEAKERNVKVFEEKTRRYNDFLKKLWKAWEDRRVTLEELNDLIESVSQDIIIYTKEENTQKLLRSLTRIAAHAGKITTTEEEKEDVQKEVFEIINILSTEMNLGGRINSQIREDLNLLENKVRPYLLAKEYKKKLLDELREYFTHTTLPVSFSDPYYEVWEGNEYVWMKINGSPVELGAGPTTNVSGTEGRFIGMFVGYYNHREYQPYRDAMRGFRKDFLSHMAWGIPVVDFNSPDSVASWVQGYSDPNVPTPGKELARKMAEYVENWRFEGRDIKSIIEECNGSKGTP